MEQEQHGFGAGHTKRRHIYKTGRCSLLGLVLVAVASTFRECGVEEEACGVEEDVTVPNLGHALDTEHLVHVAIEVSASRLASLSGGR